MATTTKHIFVTGGVASSLRQGTDGISLGNLLRARGLSVAMVKLGSLPQCRSRDDESLPARRVFVTEDGAETDLRHRFLRALPFDVFLRMPMLTTGQVYGASDRQGTRGEYLGDTPCRSSRTSPTRSRPGCGLRPPGATRPTSSSPRSVARSATSNRCPSSEAARQVRHDLGRDNSRSSRTSRWRPSRPQRRAEDRRRSIRWPRCARSARNPTRLCCVPTARFPSRSSARSR